MWSKLKTEIAALCDKIRDKLVDDIKHLHKFYSTWAAGAGAALTTVWAQLPPDVKSELPGWLVQGTAYGVLLAVVIGAAVKQNFRQSND